MITREAALERFLTERVMGDRPFALRGGGYCVYAHSCSGGCEIGQYLPAGLAEHLQGGFRDLSNKHWEVFQATFEEVESEFWVLLQVAHDQLAKYTYERNFMIVLYADPVIREQELRGRWQYFEETMQKLSWELERAA